MYFATEKGVAGSASTLEKNFTFVSTMLHVLLILFSLVSLSSCTIYVLVYT